MPWNGIEIGGILLIEGRYLSRVQGNQHIVGRRGYDLSAIAGTVRGASRHRSKWKAADRVHRVINGGLNNRSLHRTSLWRLPPTTTVLLSVTVPEHHRVRACGRALRIPPNVASGQAALWAKATVAVKTIQNNIW